MQQKTTPVISLELHPLDKLEQFIRKYVELPDEIAAIATVYAAYMQRGQDFTTSTYLHIKSATENSGKSLLGRDILGKLAPVCIECHGKTPADFRRTLKENQEKGVTSIVTLFDEIDEYFKGKGAEMIPYLNESFDKGSAPFTWREQVEILVPGKKTPKPTWVQREVNAFCPKILMGIGEIPSSSGALASRCISVNMKANKEVMPIMWPKDTQELVEVVKPEIMLWAATVDIPEPETLPDDYWPKEIRINGRMTKAWMPLFVMADAAGIMWGERIRQAALSLLNKERHEMSQAQRMKQDLREFMDRGEYKQISSRTAIDFVCSDETDWLLETINTRPFTIDNAGQFISRLMREVGIVQFRTSEGRYWNREAFD